VFSCCPENGFVVPMNSLSQGQMCCQIIASEMVLLPSVMTQPLKELGALVVHRSLLQEYLDFFIFHQQPKYVIFFNKKKVAK